MSRTGCNRRRLGDRKRFKRCEKDGKEWKLTRDERKEGDSELGLDVIAWLFYVERILQGPMMRAVAVRQDVVYETATLRR